MSNNALEMTEIGLRTGATLLQQTQLIHAKMSNILSEIGHIGKDQKNVAQGFKFRGVDQFVNALHPLLAKHRVYVRPRTLERKEQIVEVPKKDGGTRLEKHVSLLVEYIFTAEDGSSTTIGPIAAEGLDSGDKATNKALSAALKYALIQTFMVPTEDMAEADFESPTITTPVARTPDTAPAEKASVAAAPVQQKTGSSFKRPAKAAPAVTEGEDEWA